MNPEEIHQIGAYRVKRLVGAGGMAWVFEVVDPRFEEYEVVRALKLLRPEAAAGNEFQRFRAEAGMLAGLDHPNLVTLFDFGRDETTGCFFYTMTFVDGSDLDAQLRAQGPLSPDRAVEVFREVLAGLEEIHRRSIVHRDIKPHNVFIQTNGRVRLGDLGIAREEGNTGRTKTGFAVGTVRYMSPEQARGAVVHAQSDVFSVGLSLYEALTGRSVYAGIEGIDSTSDFEVIGYLASRGRQGEELEIDFDNTSIPPAIAEVIRKACRYDPDARYQDAGQMRQALRVAVGAHEAPLPSSSRPDFRWAALAVVLVIVAAGGWQAWEWMIEGGLRNGALERVAEAEALYAILPALRRDAQDLEEALPERLQTYLADQVEAAEEDLVDAREFAGLEEWKAATSTATRSIGLLEEACRKLNAEALAGAVDARAHALSQRAESLESRGAGEYMPQAWAGFKAQLVAIAGPPAATDCKASVAHLERHATLVAVFKVADSLEEELSKYLPDALEKVIATLQRKKDLAEAAAVDAQAYQARIARAQEAIVMGDAARAAGNLRGALDHYERASAAYADAAAIGPAAHARMAVRDLERRLDQLGRAPPEAVSLVISSADNSYSARRWKEAADAYVEAKELLEGFLDQGQRLGVATQKRDEASKARMAALAAGAEKSAAPQLGRGEQAYRSGVGALEAGEMGPATEQLEAARGLFRRAEDDAINALADAGDEQRELVRRLEFCDGVEAAAAVERCRTARADLSSGAEAIDQGDAPGAIARFRSSREALDAARAAEGRRPRPPTIIARRPNAKTVTVGQGLAIQLGVEANHPNGAPLRYAWDIDGTPIAGNGPGIELNAEKAGRVTVRVADDRGREASASWQIAFPENAKPRLSVRPLGKVNLAMGEEQIFTATATDPDGDRVTTTIRLDGRKVATGTSGKTTYRLRSQAPGSHRLEVAARDENGATTTLARTIKVLKREQPQPAKPSWQKNVRAALERYETALNERDLEALKDIWPFVEDSNLFAELERLMQKNREVTITIRDGDMSLQGQEIGKRTAWVELAQLEVGKRRKTVGRRIELLERRSGDWQIKAMERIAVP